jgi:hypothetical protein
MISVTDRVREAKERVARQRDIVDKMKQNGLDTAEAEGLLRELVLALDQLERLSMAAQ